MEQTKAKAALSAIDVEAAASDNRDWGWWKRIVVLVAAVGIFMLCLVATVEFSLFSPIFGILALGMLAICYVISNESRDRTCPTCRCTVPKSEWKSHLAKHRQNEINAAAELPALGGVRCPLCNKHLRLQRESSNRFKCQAGNPPCPERKGSHENQPATTFHNNGRNCFSCVGCKFDMCYNCLNRRVQGAVKRAAQEAELLQQQQLHQQLQQHQLQQQLQQHQLHQQQPVYVDVASTPADPPPPYEQAGALQK